MLQVIADFTGLNIITSDTVQGNLTLRLKDMPWDQALDIIMQTKGLDMRKNGNVVLIAPREELATKEKLELEARQQIGELEPIHTELFQLNYKKASELRDLLSASGRRQARRPRPERLPVEARHRVVRCAHEHPDRAGYERAARRDPPR